jgi:hypothetical protein
MTARAFEFNLSGYMTNQDIAPFLPSMRLSLYRCGRMKSLKILGLLDAVVAFNRVNY